MYLFLFLSYILTLLPVLTHAVKVTLRYGDDHPFPQMVLMTAQTCNNLRPGRCCQGRSQPEIPGLTNPAGPFPNYRVATFEGLEVFDLAITWQVQGTTGGCSGTPVETTLGPGSWRFPTQGSASVLLTGANYIKLPTKIPKGREAAPMLQAQGILGLITGGGGWMSKDASYSLLQQAADASLRLGGSRSGFGLMRRGGLMRREELMKRGVVSKDKGVVFAQPPPGVQWPDVITFNGTDYTETSEGSPVYKSADGQTVDFGGK